MGEKTESIRISILDKHMIKKYVSDDFKKEYPHETEVTQKKLVTYLLERHFKFNYNLIRSKCENELNNIARNLKRI